MLVYQRVSDISGISPSPPRDPRDPQDPRGSQNQGLAGDSARRASSIRVAILAVPATGHRCQVPGTAVPMPWGCLGDGGVLKRYEVPRIQGVQQRGDVRWVESTINYRSLKLGDSEKHLTENSVRWRETDNLNHFRNPQLRADHGPKSI